MVLQAVIPQISHHVRGVVDETITQRSPGRVKYLATYWPAELYTLGANITLYPRDVVQVVGRRGLVLLVTPLLPMP
jgi:membrane protein implicated in regulation of membrane protease activity